MITRRGKESPKITKLRETHKKEVAALNLRIESWQAGVFLISLLLGMVLIVAIVVPVVTWPYPEDDWRQWDRPDGLFFQFGDPDPLTFYPNLNGNQTFEHRPNWDDDHIISEKNLEIDA